MREKQGVFLVRDHLLQWRQPIPAVAEMERLRIRGGSVTPPMERRHLRKEERGGHASGLGWWVRVGIVLHPWRCCPNFFEKRWRPVLLSLKKNLDLSVGVSTGFNGLAFTPPPSYILLSYFKYFNIPNFINLSI